VRKKKTLWCNYELFMQTNFFENKKMLKAELAEMYQFSMRTMNRIVCEIKGLKPHRKHYFTSKEVKIIIDSIGTP
jgi:hypothetical protein